MEFSEKLFLPLLLGGVIISCLSPFLVQLLKAHARWPVLLVPMSLTGYFGWAALSLPEQGGWKVTAPWVSLLEANLYFSLDALSLLFSLLISFFGLLVVIYAGEYLKGHRDLGRFYLFILMFMLAMLGLVLSDHLIVLFVFWELTTFTSFLLIGFDHEREEARQSAWQAILITTSGGLAMLAGLILLGSVGGTFRIGEILAMGEVIRSSEYYLPILVLILAGAFTKSAQFPFHFWLPGAMAAPTPVSAYLHSATMVKAGIYLLARFSPALAHTDEWMVIVSGVGALTMFVGALLALRQDDLKLLLAYMTVMALGTLTFLLGLGSKEAIKAAIVFLLVHSFYKGALFLVTGSIDHGAGTRKMSELGGLLRIMPFTATAALISLLSMAGLPPLVGFTGKEMIYKATLVHGGILSALAVGVSVLAMAISAGLAGVFFFKVFLGDDKSRLHAHEGKWTLWGPPLILGGIGILLGTLSLWMESHLIMGSVSAVAGENITSKLFAGVKLDTALVLSVVSTILGVAFFFMYFSIQRLLQRSDSFLQYVYPSRLYQRGVAGFLKCAGKITEYLQSGYQLKYLSVIFTVATFLIGVIVLENEDFSAIPREFPRLAIYEWMIAGLIIAAALASLVASSLIGAVLLLGVVGYGVALLFVIYGAPDLALTQFLIETLTIILIALIAIKFPQSIRGKDSSLLTILKGVVSVAFGALMTLILWNVIQTPFDPYLSSYFAENSYSLGKGKNIVNVILVDFRALDTLGEITVLAVGSIGFFSLLKLAKIGVKS